MMEYSHEEQIEVAGLLVDVLITGRLEYDDGIITAEGPDGRLKNYPAFTPQWSHDGYQSVKMKMWDGKYKPVEGPAAEAIYERFCEMWDPEDLIEKHFGGEDYEI